MKVLAIDPSLNETGYYFMSDIEDYGSVIKSGDLRGERRLVFIRNEINELLLKYKPELIIYEDYSFASRGRATFSLGELGGILKVLFLENNIKYIVISPTQWKKFILGKGNIKKEQILMQVFKRYDKEFTNNNICDAFCLCTFGVAYGNYINGNKDFKKYELEVFEKYDKRNKNGVID